MEILVLGLGYVGTVTAAILAQSGHRVTGVDPNREKVDLINRGLCTVFEPDLDKIVGEVSQSGRLKASVVVPNGIDYQVVYVCVGTPLSTSGQSDFLDVENVIKVFGKRNVQKTSSTVIVNRSTCLPKVHLWASDHLENSEGNYEYIVHPEFLREGSAVHDFLHPPMLLFGTRIGAERVEELANCLYPSIKAPIVIASLEEASLSKYASNAFHAAKVTFANEIGNICNTLDVDARKVLEILCMDRELNISDAYMRPGLPFGGSCLPKDLETLLRYAKSSNVEIPMMSGAFLSNSLQVDRIYDLVMARQPDSVAILGLTFKSKTDDLRNSSMVNIARKLLDSGVMVTVFDRNLSTDRLIGQNRLVMEEELPELPTLIRYSLKNTLEDVDIVLVAHSSYGPDLANEELCDHQVVVDLVGIENRSFGQDIFIQGLYW